jgi:hypothetical protein
MARFCGVSEMKQNPANFAMGLSKFSRIQSNIIKYRLRCLNAIEMRA